jgi:hypothetical protein
MARPLRIEYRGALYHVTCRGNARDRIFLIDLDREFFLQTPGVPRVQRLVDRPTLGAIVRTANDAPALPKRASSTDTRRRRS